MAKKGDNDAASTATNTLANKVKIENIRILLINNFPSTKRQDNRIFETKEKVFFNKINESVCGHKN